MRPTPRDLRTTTQLSTNRPGVRSLAGAIQTSCPSLIELPPARGQDPDLQLLGNDTTGPDPSDLGTTWEGTCNRGEESPVTRRKLLCLQPKKPPSYPEACATVLTTGQDIPQSPPDLLASLQARRLFPCTHIRRGQCETLAYQGRASHEHLMSIDQSACRKHPQLPRHCRKACPLLCGQIAAEQTRALIVAAHSHHTVQSVN